MKKTNSLLRTLRTSTVPTIALGALCTLGAFVIGIRTSGDVKPFGTSEAALEASLTGGPVEGDVNDNNILDVQDAIIILEFAQKLETPTQDDIVRGDTDGDFVLTVKDALTVLHGVSLR
jgi:hypothetical protein